MNIVAIQTARSGSKSVPNKNTMQIGGFPLFLHNLMVASRCPLITKTFVTTDDPQIKKWAEVNCTKVIDRPTHLCGDDSSHYETITHALGEAEKELNCQADIIVVLLGNSRGIRYPEDLTAAITKLQTNQSASSCISVSRYNMFNPYRAYKLNANTLTSYIDQEHIPDVERANDKNAFGDALFFNGSFWIIRRSAIILNNGLKPFPWLGNKILPYIQDEGIMELDAGWQLPLLKYESM